MVDFLGGNKMRTYTLYASKPKSGIIEDLSVIKNETKHKLNSEESDIFSKTSGMISSHNIDPI